ncbi:MAG: hypothetical protein L0332_18560 [Chloroflexi bacterium]|nr:hypothetical protein [Chloroflexota bacterium]MCI0580840.1 hypothetical protein [Chloroflexota bacterium]MCI0645545.1 hypothetical protein [Chloroflexota bacterium]MCI0728701.1 hypothetical protein [Chloroflexota bacterium]
MSTPNPSAIHPADAWQQASREQEDKLARLRLAAMAGHMRQDLVTARRAALIDLLSDGGVYTRQAIWETIQVQLGRPCWGKRPEETLWRDLKALRAGGVRIAYSRRRGIEGYYLQHPPLERPPSRMEQPINWEYVTAIRQMSVVEKNQQTFAAADFALRQKRLILAEEHPEWSAEEVDATARRLVYGRHEVP